MRLRAVRLPRRRRTTTPAVRSAEALTPARDDRAFELHEIGACNEDFDGSANRLLSRIHGRWLISTFDE
jgi:hypothetical protein